MLFTLLILILPLSWRSGKRRIEASLETPQAWILYHIRVTLEAFARQYSSHILLKIQDANRRLVRSLSRKNIPRGRRCGYIYGVSDRDNYLPRVIFSSQENLISPVAENILNIDV